MIKSIFISILILLSIQAHTQVKSYDELALTLSQEKMNGTARYLGMGGAFGALGGDFSSVEINPAGMAFFNESSATISLNMDSKSQNNKFYNADSNNETNTLHVQAGISGVFFESGSIWSKFVIGANVSISNDFNSLISLKGNNGLSNESYFLEPEVGVDLFDNVSRQTIYNKISGDNTKTTFSLATKYNRKTYFGISYITNSVDYFQEIRIKEESSDINSQTFVGDLNQTLTTYGQGHSFGFGVITKPFKNLRLGLSVQTPTWYSLTEEFYEKLRVDINDPDLTQPPITDFIAEYSLRTPSKFTGSIAYIFGKKGLVSLDYGYKNYNNAKLNLHNVDFTDNNNNMISANYTGASTLNIGGEYRFKYISLRAGYHYEDTPYKSDIQKYLNEGYSYGLGFRSGDYSKLDFAINNVTSYEKNYYLNAPQAIISKNDYSKFTVTYTYEF